MLEVGLKVFAPQILKTVRIYLSVYVKRRNTTKGNSLKITLGKKMNEHNYTHSFIHLVQGTEK